MRKPLKWIVLILVLIGLILMLVILGRFLTGAIGLIHTDGDLGTDPQFAEPMQTTTRPPEMVEEAGSAAVDHSDEWTANEETPVDWTVDELQRMADDQNTAID